jgi:rhomboid protease GluP
VGVDHEPAKPKQPDDDAWIERVVGVAGRLGVNQVRLRWKLIRFQNERRKRANLRQQRAIHIAYAHKTCASCGAIQDRDEAVCTHCGDKLGRRGVQVVRRLGLAMPVALSMSTLLALAILAAYARVWLAAGGGLASPSGQLLVDFGGRLPPLIADEPWRLVTAMFLHAGLLHLGFNILALATVGPRVEEIYGRATMIGLFIATGALANLGALGVGGYAVGIGASGGVMGLIGAAAGAGHRTGTGAGHALRNAMVQWMAYTFIAGFALGADNWAHLFGAITGAGFGLAVQPRAWARRAMAPARAALGVLGIAGTLGALAIILTRTPAPRPDPTERRRVDTHEVRDADLAPRAPGSDR